MKSLSKKLRWDFYFYFKVILIYTKNLNLVGKATHKISKGDMKFWNFKYKKFGYQEPYLTRFKYYELNINPYLWIIDHGRF
jgi:hypothetical protein